MKKSFFLLAISLFIVHYTIAQKKGGKELTNELIWYSSEFSPEYVSGVRSMKDGLHYTSLEYSEENGSEIVKYAYSTGEKVGVIASSKMIFNEVNTRFDDYEFSPDETKILIKTEQESIYRHSTKAHYFVYLIQKNRAFPLADRNKGKQRLATFSPLNDMVAFVRDNNIFIVDINQREEVQVTFDGERNKIINGATDWVYEEEFGFDKGFYWSPKGDRIAYYKFNEEHVKEYQMAIYGSLYPEQYKFKYPKAGEKNSIVSIFIYDVNAMISKLVDTGIETDIYIPRIKWTTDNNKLCIMRLNRHQNHLQFLMTDLRKSQPFALKTYLIYSEKADTYIEINDNLTFLEDGKYFLWNSERSGYNHLYLFDMNGEVKKQLTSGEFDVIDFYGLDEEKGNIYFSSAQESPLQKHIYVTNLKGKKPTRLSEKAGQNDASFSNTFEYFINYHSDANSPYFISLHNRKGKLIRVLKDNQKLKDKLDQYELSEKEFFTFENTSGTTLNAWMIKPPSFDPSKKYPVYVVVYGGPGHNTVTDGWGGRNYLWYQLLAQKGYIVTSVDPRGTMFRGREFKHSTYMQLGKLETEDLIDFAKYLGNQPFIDSARIGIQGWSYGGYMTSLAMTKGADYFKMGIAVAPVTNWRFYDSIYTERFMRTPEENAAGYDDNSPINYVDLLKGAYLLIHGSADDNVHFQNSMEMADALIKANKDFDFFVYPNKNHGIYGGNTRLHLFNKMLSFVEENL